jgi:hypothetical protein
VTADTEQRARGLRARAFRKVQYTLFRQRWNIALTPYPIHAVAGLDGARRQVQALQALDWMAESPDYFAADPFVAIHPARPGDVIVFYEHYPWATGRGVIARVPYADGKFHDVQVVLDSGYHLSYPFTVVREDRLAIVPEHSAARDLSSYDVSTGGSLIDKTTIQHPVELLDCTFVEWGGLHWMFATHPGPAENAELHAYYATTPNGPWQAHAANPVQRGLGHARPAGQCFVHMGKLFRPAQDCRASYGAGIVVNEVVRLSADDFYETPASEIRPLDGCPYDYGLHTLSSTGNYTAIDGARMESTIHPALDRFAATVRSLGR